jgi:hypothetical protein
MSKPFAWLGVAMLAVVCSASLARAGDPLKPYVVLVLDTSGSMVCTGADPGCDNPTGFGPPSCGGIDTRLSHAKCAINNIVNSYGDMVFALARFRTTMGGATVGAAVTIAGVANAAYNGTWNVITTPTVTQFTATIATSGPAASGGGSANGDQDDMLATRWNLACHAEHGANDVFDLSGNAKEWTQARAPNQNPLRGGSANNAVNGLTCKLNFTLADNTFFFPNVGFRCCRD